jgi:hypothetical protein
MPVKVKTAVESRKCAFYRMGQTNLFRKCDEYEMSPGSKRSKHEANAANAGANAGAKAAKGAKGFLNLLHLLGGSD